MRPGAERTTLIDTAAPLGAAVVLSRSPRGWSVTSPRGVEPAGDLVEGLSLADLVAEEFGPLAVPDRATRRAIRGSAADGVDDDPAATRIAVLEHTVAQLEHALSARVATERAIGVLAERHGTSSRAAFDTLRRDARSQGRPVAELAGEVLAGLGAEGTDAAPSDADAALVSPRVADGRS